MKRYQVHFRKEKKTIEVEEGCTILEAQRRAGIVQDAPCGGRGECKKCRVKANGAQVLACRTKIGGDMEVETGRTESPRILLEGSERSVKLDVGELPDDAARPALAAVDLGTTSVVVYLMDAVTGETLAVKSMLNPQKQFGADVISRCSYAMENGAAKAARCVREAVSLLMREAARECGRSREDIVRVVMVGNTCMHHLFLELPVHTLVVAPYRPWKLEAQRLMAVDYGLSTHPFAQLWWLPNIGGFVGADTMAGILACGLEQREKITLMVDIGTNGEMVLGNCQGLLACSTAAGPAFEGARISCGMRGSKGAIDRVWIEGGKLKFHVIGEEEPLGICGSGLLDAAACFLELGLLDETGKMSKDWYFTPKIYINQKDIRELQLAKAAIAAGIRILCKRRQIEIDEIEELILAGAFGNYLNPKSACAIGLLPAELQGRIRMAGNAAGEGARIAALNEKEFARCTALARQVSFVELAMDGAFQDIYVEELEFPEMSGAE